ncbi:MAG: metallophosphoesterase [Aggregatilineales bacterium]
MTEVLLKFAHISDTHLVPGDHQEFRPHHYSERLLALFKEAFERGEIGHRTEPKPSVASRALIDEINRLPFELDFVLHTGDIQTDPDTVEEYEATRTVMAALNYPIYYLPGNHDLLDGVRSLMPDMAVEGETFDYVIDRGGVRVICLDSATHGRDHAGGVSEAQLGWLRDRLAEVPDARVIVAVHHPPLSFGFKMLDLFGFANGEALHQVLSSAAPRVQVVLSGHVHQSVDIIQDGIYYTCVQCPTGQIAFWPGLDAISQSAPDNYGFNIVIVTAERTYVRRYPYQLNGRGTSEA